MIDSKIKIIFTIVIITVIVFTGLIFFLLSNGQTQIQNLDTKQFNELKNGEQILGDVNAPVTIIVFSDFECPYCKIFEEKTLQQIEEKYIKKGKVNFIFKHLPGHFNSQKAAEASECASEQGKFWEMHDKLFEEQGFLDIPYLKLYAKELGLDETEFNNCLESGKTAEQVNKEKRQGLDLGITGTPMFYINGELVVGAKPYGYFEDIIDKKLNQ